MFDFKYLHSLKTEYEKRDEAEIILPNQSLLTRILNFFIDIVSRLSNSNEKELNSFVLNFVYILTEHHEIQKSLLQSFFDINLGKKFNHPSFESVKNHLYDASETQKATSNIISKHEEKTARGITKKELKDRSSGNNGGLII